MTFEETYRTHFAFVWRTVRRLGVADSSVEDVTQDTFLVVHRRLASFNGKSSLKSWLFGIVVRVVSDAHDSNASISTLKAFAVESGKPGVVEA